MKKVLTALLIGAFVFGVSVSDVNFASAKSVDRNVAQTHEATHHTQDGQNPPEPPKDSDGKPLPPPSDNNGSDTRHHNGQNPPEPPKDSDGKPLPPPDRNGNETENHDGHTPTEHADNAGNHHQQK